MTCRICLSDTETIFPMGRMPLPNKLLTSPDDTYDTYPLNLEKCLFCGHAQLDRTLPPSAIFDDYGFFSSYSKPLLDRMERLSSIIQSKGTHFLNSNTRVVEIGSNDGYLLQFYQKSGIPVLGVDPSIKAANAAALKGIPTAVEYFSLDTAKKLLATYGPARVIHAHNVLAHVPDPNDFVQGLRTLLDPEGIIIVEVQYAKYLTFDQIYHEHVSYFSINSIVRLFEQNDLQVQEVNFISDHGGSLQVVIQKGMFRKIVKDQMNWNAWVRNTCVTIDRLETMLADKWRGVVAGFGASAKATIMLNKLQHSGDFAYIVDDTPEKQGKYIPGTKIQVVKRAVLEASPADFLFLFAWNYADAIMAQFPEYKGRFIIPFPEPRIA